ncbi:BTB/POZ domain-containing protein 19 [Colias croceus]|uniref:BTB/POZ domain-containing protein 19 n=1 Tax=Colias crocea TaxID=72248 RepID=UPI001E27C485|nr:BTB/POZ domain-containing protein 19 [Colias croceus]XP_045496053.1 BTB/POZ domain-containing protein 19 [Colias croceus]XP_045496054.1 BTB/POZ domain-containing protein 19 [Colias croceus]
MANRVSSTCCTASVERAGLPGLLRDLQRLSEDQDSADIVFILGTAEEKVFAHKIILIARCRSFQNTKRGEVCRIPGCTVTPSVGAQPTPIRMPHVQPETFRLFIQYVYTGKLLLQDSGVFEMMTLAADLGVEDLRAACEDHVTSTLSVESACTLLAAAMEIQDRPGGKSASSFMERCITFIGDNAAECVKSNAFLNLPKEALIKLISSDFLCLEEEEVWRCALAWAKQRAGVTQPTAHWTEEERARVCHHLAPLMHHIRLLLIDSAVFAEEVEPTGAVPMELSLERYRRAALHKARPDPDKRTQPRLAVNMFAGSVILQQDKSAFQSVINSWCGTPKQSWRLVFRASTHGFSAQAFHSHCDGISPVLLLVQLSRGEIIGGWCESGWSAGGSGGAGGYVSAERGLLFALTEPPALYTLSKKAFALCYHPDCGPIFGAGADLLISNNCNSNTDSYSNLHSYGDSLSPASLAPDYSFTVRDYEIFTIKHN